MKTYKRYLILVIALLPLLTGCPEQKTVITKVNKDGSLTRTLGDFDLRKYDGIDSIMGEVPVPIDHSWKLDTLNDTTAVLSKSFKNIDELSASYASDKSSLNAYHRKVGLKKKFNWFHTDFQYSETCQGLLTEIPLRDYLTEKEIEIYKSRDPGHHPDLMDLDSISRKSLLDNIEGRYDDWFNESFFSKMFNDLWYIADSANLLSNVNATVKSATKELIRKNYTLDFLFNDSMDIENIAKLVGQELSMDSATMAMFKSLVKKADLEKRYEEELFAGISEDYENELIMPGVLIDTNADMLKGDTLSWKVDLIEYLDSDFVMTAESKVTNFWAYVLSGLVIIIALSIPFLRKWKG